MSLPQTMVAGQASSHLLHPMLQASVPLVMEGLRKLDEDTFNVVQLDNLSICLYSWGPPLSQHLPGLDSE